MLPQGGILLRYHRPIRCTPTSTTRCISRPSTSKEASYRLSGESDYFAAPAQAVHKFEIIQYANSTGDIF